MNTIENISGIAPGKPVLYFLPRTVTTQGKLDVSYEREYYK